MRREPRNVAVAAVLVGVAALWLHWPSVQYSSLHWDDPVHVEDAQKQQRLSWAAVRCAFTTIRPFFYFPLTRLLNVLNFQHWGTDPAVYHASSVVLHGATSGLVTVFIWLLLRSVPAMPAAGWLVMAAGVGLVFAIHPCQVGTVDWFAEQLTVLSALFSIASRSGYVMAVEGAGDSRRRWWVMDGLSVAALNHRARRYEDAAAELNSALRLDPGLIFARYGLSRTVTKLGRLDEEFESQRHVLPEQPQFANPAQRDLELADLRDHADYADRFHTLIVGGLARSESTK